MCFSERISWMSFLMAFVTFPYVYSKTKSPILLAYFFGIFMQFWEALLHRDPTNQFAYYGAFIFNMLQPIILYLIVNPSRYTRMHLLVISISITLWLIEIQNHLQKKHVKPIEKGECGLNLSWWSGSDKINAKVYLLTQLVCFMVVSEYIAITDIDVFLYSINFIINMFVYAKCDNRSSLWCYSINAMPFIYLIKHHIGCT